MDNTIQIREENRVFSRKSLANILNVSTSAINYWAKNGKVPSLSEDFRSFSINEIEDIVLDPGFLSKVNLKARLDVNYKEALDFELVTQENGLFTVASSCLGDKEINFTDQISKYGLWNAQGLNNHENLIDYEKNPILQYLLAVNIVNKWLAQVRRLRPKGKTIIYLNGRINTTVCIYQQSVYDENFLKENDKSLKIEQINVMHLSIGDHQIFRPHLLTLWN